MPSWPTGCCTQANFFFARYIFELWCCHCQAPLNSDIEALSQSLKSGTEEPQWFRTTRKVDEIVDDACDAVVAAGRGAGQISTLILPADISWADGAPEARKADIPARPKVADERIEAALAILQRYGLRF
jgi:acetolactate synthase-1/2/3 large subunit